MVDRELQLGRDPDFEKRWWRIQRVSWILLGLGVLAGSLGVFGGGVLSTVRQADAEGALVLIYQRFLRVQTPTDLKVTLRRDHDGEAGQLWLELDEAYLSCMKVREISPQPASSEVLGGWTRYHFQFRAGSLQIRYELLPQRPGVCRGLLRSPEQARVLWHFVYP